MSLLLYLCLFLLFYAFTLYPLLLALGAARRETGVPPAEAEPPTVSMLLSVYNEEAVIAEKIRNFQALEYPAERLELLVISDGSTDKTDELTVSAQREDPRIRLLQQEGRLGKTSALNLAAAEAKGEILFFTDADSRLRPDCLRRLVRPFADPGVGLVGGRSLYLDAQGRETVGSLYRRHEEWLKEREGKLYGIVGADGAVYAMRAELYRPLAPEYINDLLHPIQVVMEGRQAVAAPEALVLEPGATSDDELARQTRIMAQSWLVFFRHWRLLARGGCKGFLWQFFSHKVLRWSALPLLILAGLGALVTSGFWASATLCGLLLLAVLAFCGARGRAGRLGRAARLFVLQGTAGMLGLYRLMRGERFVIWAPRGRRE